MRQRWKGPRWFRHLQALAVAAVLVTALVWAVAHGAAALLYGPDLLLSTQPRVADAGFGELQARVETLELALRLDPMNPGYRAALGRVYEHQARHLVPGGDAARGLLDAALARYREAAMARPTWPYDRAAMVRVRLKLGQRDARLSDELRDAIALGRWEPGVQRALLAPALAIWPYLAAADRVALEGLLRAALQVQPRWVMEQAGRSRRGALLRPLIAGDPRLERLALRYGAIDARP